MQMKNVSQKNNFCRNFFIIKKFNADSGFKKRVGAQQEKQDEMDEKVRRRIKINDNESISLLNVHH